MNTRARRATRTLLAGLAVVGLLGACGGDDDKKDDDKTTTTDAPDEGTDEGTTDEGASADDIDVCGLLDLDTLNQATGEEFTNLDEDDDDLCTVTNDDETASIIFSVEVLDDGVTEADYIAGQAAQCDEGTVDETIDFTYVEGNGVACKTDGLAAVVVAYQGGAAGIIGSPSTEVPDEALFAALNQIVQGVVAS